MLTIIPIEKVFPTALIIQQLIASVPYWYQGDWRMGVYCLSPLVKTMHFSARL